jgi:hypothetical protein
MSALHDQVMLARMVELWRSGFTFGPLPGLFGVDGVYACRIGPGQVEAVVLRASDSADGIRVTDSFDPARPFLAPEVLWSASGTVAAVVDTLPSPQPRRS